MFFARKSKISTPFFGYRSWLFAHVLYESLPSPWWKFFLFTRFWPEILDLLRPKHPQKNTWYKKKRIWRNTHTFANGLTRVYTTRVSNFRVYLQKTASTLCAQQFWGDMLEPGCSTFSTEKKEKKRADGLSQENNLPSIVSFFQSFSWRADLHNRLPGMYGILLIGSNKCVFFKASFRVIGTEQRKCCSSSESSGEPKKTAAATTPYNLIPPVECARGATLLSEIPHVV